MSTNGEGNVGKVPDSTLLLEKMQSLEKLMLTVSAENEKLRNHHEQKFNALSDRLQSIEASIQKSNNVSEKEPINESIVSTNNTTNMTSKTMKRFQLKHVFNNVANFMQYEYHYSEWEEHYNMKWKMSVKRHNKHLCFFNTIFHFIFTFSGTLKIEGGPILIERTVYGVPIALADNWSIQTKLEFKIVGPNQNGVIRKWETCYGEKRGWGFLNFLEWEDMEKWYLVNGNLQVEAKVTIVEAAGLAKPKVRKFDESQRDVSDVILVVRDTKFYVLKMFLASQSSVFKALLVGGFSESKQSEVTLNGIDPEDFHYFLEVLYGESAIDDTTVEGVALLADMYDAPTAIRRCEEFLMEKSKKKLGKKLGIATQYNLENLKEKCMSEITILEDQAAVPRTDNR